MITGLKHVHRRQGPSGFGLIEVMVGLVVGMLAVLVMTQLLSSIGVSRRVAAGAGDALTNTAVAAYGIEREIRDSGQGLSSYLLLGCALEYTTGLDGAKVTLDQLAPVFINPPTRLVPAGDMGSDTLLVVGGSSPDVTEGSALTAVSSASVYKLDYVGGFRVGDQVLAAQSSRPATCTLKLGRVTAVAAGELAVSDGTAGVPLNGRVFNLGGTPTIEAFAVRNGDLTRCDYRMYDCGSASYLSPLNSNVWVPLGSNVVSMRAQYARDTTGASAGAGMDGEVDIFDQVSPGIASDTASSVPYQCRWGRILGVRFALVGRSQQYEKTAVTSSVPVWDGTTAVTSTSSSATTLNPTAVPIDLSANAQWKNYRYRTVQSTVPLRNSIWNGAQATYQGGSSGC